MRLFVTAPAARVPAVRRRRIEMRAACGLAAAGL